MPSPEMKIQSVFETVGLSSDALPPPVPVRRYRYSRLRWRVLVHLIDGAGYLLMWLIRIFIKPENAIAVKRILIVQLDHLGDAVLTTTMLRRLQQHYPQARIDVLASAANEEVFLASSFVNEVHVADRNWFERRSGCWAMFTAAWRLGWRMRGQRYDLGIDVRGDILSIFLMVLAGIPKRAGWAMGGGGFWLTDIAEWQPGRHEVLSRMAILESLGIAIPPTDCIKTELTISPNDRLWIGRHLCRLWTPHQWLQACLRGGDVAFAQTKLVSPLVVLHPGAGTQAKRWPIVFWRRLILQLREQGFFVAIIGSAEDMPVAEMLQRRPGVIDLTGRLKLTETLALMEKAAFFIGVDSGPAHLTSVVGIKSVVLFSGTNRASQWRPWSRAAMGLRKKVSCSPCHQKLCPLESHACMTGISPERVIRAALWWWKRGVNHDGNQTSGQKRKPSAA
jgi:lipopolysaccharide heptosyltransferase II